MVIVAKFLGLVILLNIIRYVVAGPIEAVTVFTPLFGVMTRNDHFFNTQFTPFDWITSYLYNFFVWLSAAWVFHLARPQLRGSDLVASFKAFGLAWLFFAAVSGVYMNHYSLGRPFYLWNVADAVIAFSVVAAANGLLYRRIMGAHAAEAPAKSI